MPLGGSVTLDVWRDLFADPAFGDSAALHRAGRRARRPRLSAALALLICAGLRRRSTLQRTLMALPVPVPHLLVAVAAVLWLGPGGLAERLLGGLPVDLVGDRHGLGIVLVYVYKETPFLVLLLLAASGQGLRRARRGGGGARASSRFQRLRWVLWPALRGPLIVGSTVVAAFVIGAFEVPLIVGPELPDRRSPSTRSRPREGDLIAGEGTAAATLLVAAAAAMLLAAVAVRFARDAQGD